MHWLQGLLDNLREQIPKSGEVPANGTTSGIGSILNALDWDQVREEVDRESRARLVFIGAIGAGKSTLLNTLKGSEVSLDRAEPEAGAELTLEDFGLFAIVDVPARSPNGQLPEGDTVWLVLNSAELIVWVLDGASGMRAWEHEWICRLRALGRPLLIVLNKIDQVVDKEVVRTLNHTLACTVIPIEARDFQSINESLLPQLVAACPNLALPLGREVLGWRRTAAQRVINRSAVVSGLIGTEPAPLIDLPLQVLIQLRLILRLGAIYGEPVNDRYSRELLVTMASSVALRTVSQQIVKLIPLAGWIISGALAAGGTWAIGELAQRYFENGRQVPRPTVRLPHLKWPVVRLQRPHFSRRPTIKWRRQPWRRWHWRKETKEHGQDDRVAGGLDSTPAEQDAGQASE
jgi:small GTP-binding protein